MVRATEELIEKHNPAWRLGNLNGVHPRWLRDLGEAGFRDIESFSYDVDVAYAHAVKEGATAHREPYDAGAMRVGFVLDPEGRELELISMRR